MSFAITKTVSRPIQLLDLPLELLQLIVSQLCIHCRHEPIPIWKPIMRSLEAERIWEGRANLIALTLTSKALRDIAQPTLLHSLLIHNRGIEVFNDLRDRLLAAVSLFDTQPHMTRFVSDVDIGAFNEDCPCCYPDRLDNATEEQQQTVERAVANLGFLPSDYDIKELCSEDNMIETLVQLLILQTKKAKRIALCLPKDWTFRLIGQKLLGDRTDYMLLNVTCMEIELQWQRGDECCEVSDGRPCYAPRSHSIAEGTLIAIAPNLRTLWCRGESLLVPPQAEYSKFSRIESLQLVLKSQWGPFLSRLLQKTQNLRKVSFVMRNAHCATPHQIELALLPIRDTLESLNLLRTYYNPAVSRAQYFFESDESESAEHREDWHPAPGIAELYPMTTLKNFTALKVLAVDVLDICPYPRSGSRPWATDPLVNLLPQSLEVLLLRCMGSYKYAVPESHFKALAETVVVGQFPNLRWVFWTSEGQGYIMRPRKQEKQCLRSESPMPGKAAIPGTLGIESGLTEISTQRAREKWLEQGLWKEALSHSVAHHLEYNSEPDAFLDFDALMQEWFQRYGAGRTWPANMINGD